MPEVLREGRAIPFDVMETDNGAWYRDFHSSTMLAR
jgi:hypothetical protein